MDRRLPVDAVEAGSGPLGHPAIGGLVPEPLLHQVGQRRAKPLAGRGQDTGALAKVEPGSVAARGQDRRAERQGPVDKAGQMRGGDGQEQGAHGAQDIVQMRPVGMDLRLHPLHQGVIEADQHRLGEGQAAAVEIPAQIAQEAQDLQVQPIYPGGRDGEAVGLGEEEVIGHHRQRQGQRRSRPVADAQRIGGGHPRDLVGQKGDPAAMLAVADAGGNLPGPVGQPLVETHDRSAQASEGLGQPGQRAIGHEDQVRGLGLDQVQHPLRAAGRPPAVLEARGVHRSCHFLH